MRVFHCFTITLKAMMWAVLAITGTALASQARAAFERGDYELAISQARDARRFAELGIRQLDFPPYQHFE